MKKHAAIKRFLATMITFACTSAFSNLAQADFTFPDKEGTVQISGFHSDRDGVTKFTNNNNEVVATVGESTRVGGWPCYIRIMVKGVVVVAEGVGSGPRCGMLLAYLRHGTQERPARITFDIGAQKLISIDGDASPFRP